MRKPPVRLESPADVETIYGFYEAFEPNPRIKHGLQVAQSVIWRPDVYFLPETDEQAGAKEQIRDKFESGRQAEMAIHHVSNSDLSSVTSAVVKEPVLWPLLPDTAGPGKPSLFQNRLLRLALDHTDAKPIWREEDKLSGDGAIRLRALAAERVIKLLTAHFDAGGNVLIFPGGTRVKDPAKKLIVPELNRGMGRIICGVTKVEQPFVMPIGIIYPDHRRWNQPTIVFGYPSNEHFDDPRAVVKWARPAMQAAVTAADDFSRQELLLAA